MVVSQIHLRRHERLDRFFNTEFHSRVEDEPAETPVGGTAKRFGLQRTAAGAIVNGLGGDGFWRVGKGRKEVNILRRRESGQDNFLNFTVEPIWLSKIHGPEVCCASLNLDIG